MIDLKENLVSRHNAFLEANQTNPTVDGLRKEAIEIFNNEGFPKRKDEEWKYTNVAPLVKVDYTLNAEAATVDAETINGLFVNNLDSNKVVFVNGKFDVALSSIASEEVTIKPLSEVLVDASYQEVVAQFYGKIALKNEAFVALNNAYATEGFFVQVAKNKIVEKPIEVLYITTGNTQEALLQPRNLVVIGDQAKVQIIEKHVTLNETANLTNALTEVNVGKNADLYLYKFQNDTDHASLIDNTYINQERDSRAHVFTFAFGGKVVRNNLNFFQNGENCNSVMDGITMIENKQHVDHHTFVEHNFPNCESHELYKGIYDGKSEGVFNGKIYVHKEAQKLNAFQQNNNVLLSDTASINTKPQLEIFADDVKCSHGCTVGQLAEDSLFYMQQRGIPKKEAKALLLYAFASDALQRVEIEQVQDVVNHMIAAKLGVDIDFELN
ncbi:MAG TPA: Fe-S cluster assembly protein SufD [Faecalibacter sp.]